WQIAKAHNLKVNDLKRWNRLSGNSLKVGQVLRLSGAASTASTSNSGARQAVTYYRVQKGDSYYLIAKRFKVDMRKLQSWNPRNGSQLKPGQTLTLYLSQ